jgi:hypothetical protein
MFAIAENLTCHGYTTKPEKYELPYMCMDKWGDHSTWHVIKGFHGRFSDKKLQADAWDKESIHYTYGLLFNPELDPTSSISPWVPYLYFLKRTLISPGPWNFWDQWDSRLVYSSHLESSDRSFKYLHHILPSKDGKLKELSHRLTSALFAKIPLGAMSSSEDVRKIVSPLALALRTENEDGLTSIAEYW